MFSAFLLVFVYPVQGQDPFSHDDLVYDDLPGEYALIRMENGHPPHKTLHASFVADTGLLPTFPKTTIGETQGWIHFDQTGLGIGVKLGAQAIDLAVLQEIAPFTGYGDDSTTESFNQLQAFKDSVDSITFDLRYGPGGDVNCRSDCAVLQFGINIAGSLTLPNGAQSVCFKDGEKNIEEFVAKNLDGPGAQPGPTVKKIESATSGLERPNLPLSDDAKWAPKKKLDWCAGAPDCPEVPEANDDQDEPAPTYVEGKFMWDVQDPEAGRMYDGTYLYDVTTLELVLAKKPTSTIYDQLTAIWTGPDPAFEGIVDIRVTDFAMPSTGPPPPLPAFCTSYLTTADLANSMALTSRRLVGVETLSHTLATHILKKLHGAHKLFRAYQREEESLARRALVGYAVLAGFVLLFATSSGRFLKMRKWEAVVAPADQELLVEEGIANCENAE